MATVEGIRARLKDSFTEQQADLLAHVVVEAHADYVTRGDFQALTSVVRELAEAQQRTEVRMEELADAQRGLAAAQERTEARMEELAEAQREFTWAMRDTRKQLGGLAQSVGYGLEAYAMERIPRILEQRFGFVTESSAPENIGGDGEEYAFDVVYRGTANGHRVVVLCEVKTNITIAEVEDFVSIAMRAKPHVDASDVRMLFFGYRAGHKAQRLIADHGAMLAFPRGLIVS